jgi:hypothetical protein
MAIYYQCHRFSDRKRSYALAFNVYSIVHFLPCANKQSRNDFCPPTKYETFCSLILTIPSLKSVLGGLVLRVLLTSFQEKTYHIPYVYNMYVFIYVYISICRYHMYPYTYGTYMCHTGMRHKTTEKYTEIYVYAYHSF